MYCQINLIKPDAAVKSAMANLFSQRTEVTVRIAENPVTLHNLRFSAKHCSLCFQCSSDSREILQQFCRKLNRKFKDTTVQLVMLTEGNKNRNYIIIDFSKGKSKTAVRGCCSNDWTVKDIVQLHILEKTVSGYYA